MFHCIFHYALYGVSFILLFTQLYYIDEGHRIIDATIGVNEPGHTISVSHVAYRVGNIQQQQ